MRTHVLAALFLALSFAGLAQAQEPSLHAFVKPQYYLGSGGEPASLSQVATEPLKYFRSNEAYDVFRHHVGSYLGQASLDDAEFRRLFQSDDVRLTECRGVIETAGITKSGHVRWQQRPCYEGEKLIELKVNGVWVVVASQGCYNPVAGKVPATPPPTETTCRCVNNDSTTVYSGISLGGTYIASCPPTFVPGIATGTYIDSSAGTTCFCQ